MIKENKNVIYYEWEDEKTNKKNFNFEIIVDFNDDTVGFKLNGQSNTIWVKQVMLEDLHEKLIEQKRKVKLN